MWWGTGELDDVALLDTRKAYTGLVGCDSEFERRGRRICWQRRDAEYNEGGRDQHGKQLGRQKPAETTCGVCTAFSGVRKQYISSQFLRVSQQVQRSVFRLIRL